MIRRFQDFLNQHPKLIVTFRWTAIGVGAFVVLTALVTVIACVRLSRSLDSRLADAMRAPLLYSAPQYISVGDQITSEEIVRSLKSSGYTTEPSNPIGFYRLQGSSVLVNPGPKSYAPGKAV